MIMNLWTGARTRISMVEATSSTDSEQPPHSKAYESEQHDKEYETN